VAFIDDHQKVVREKIEETERSFTRLTTVKIAGVVFDAGTMPQLLDHFHVVSDPFVQAFGLIGFANTIEKGHLFIQVFEYLLDGCINAFLTGHKEVGRENAVF